jgi:predicted GNAT family acetyltransferase
MSLFARPRAGLRVREAGPADSARLLAFLDRKPAENVFLSHLVRRDSLERARGSRSWHVAEHEGEVQGVCVNFSNVVPAVDGEEAAAELGRALGRLRNGTQSVVGERSAVSALWDMLRRRAPAPRLIREEQPFYVMERSALLTSESSKTGGVRLRLAAGEDLDILVRACADMLREEILDDPYSRDPAAFRTQVWRLVQENAIFVGEAGGRIVFKAHANVRTPLAAQISGVYTLPEHRSRGYATVGMAALAERLLTEHPVLCLYVNRDNDAAIRTYEAVGFRRTGTFKSIFFGPGG